MHLGQCLWLGLVFNTGSLGVSRDYGPGRLKDLLRFVALTWLLAGFSSSLATGLRLPSVPCSVNLSIGSFRHGSWLIRVSEVEGTRARLCQHSESQGLVLISGVTSHNFAIFYW